jgi:hypothetical protein
MHCRSKNAACEIHTISLWGTGGGGKSTFDLSPLAATLATRACEDDGNDIEIAARLHEEGRIPRVFKVHVAVRKQDGGARLCVSHMGMIA